MGNIDPEGQWILNALGAFASGAIDYGSQVAVNYASGKTGTQAWTDVSWGSVAVSAVEGAINPIGGVTKSVVKSAAKTTVRSIAKNVIKEGLKGAGVQVIDNTINGDELTNNLGLSTVVSSVTGNMKVAPSGKNAKTTINKAVKKTTSNPKTGKVAGTLTKAEKKAVESAKSELKANVQ